MLSMCLVHKVRDASSVCGGASGVAPMCLIVTVLSMGCHGHVFQDWNLVWSRLNTYGSQIRELLRFLDLLDLTKFSVW